MVWPGLRLEHLEALRAVAEAGSFRAAARRLGYSQSAVSEQIAALEAVVGERLLVRDQPVVPTSAGEVLLGCANGIAAMLRAAERRLRERVAIGVAFGAGSLFLPQALAEAGAEAELVEALDDRELFALLDRGELDVAIATLPPVAGDYVVEPLLVDELLAVVVPDHPLASAQSVELRDLRRALTLRSCRTSAALLDAAMRSDDVDTLIELLDDGSVALLPSLRIPQDRGLVVRALAERPTRRIGLVWHTDRPPSDAAAAFADACRALCVGARRLAPQRFGEPLRVSLAGVR